MLLLKADDGLLPIMIRGPIVVAVMIAVVVSVVVIFVTVVVIFTAISIIATVSFHCPAFYLHFVAKNIHCLSVQLVAEKVLPPLPPSPIIPILIFQQL